MTTIELLRDKHPSEILVAEVRARVLVSTGPSDLAGTEIVFLFVAIEWEGYGCEDGGVTISYPDHPYCVVEIDSMIFTGAG